MLASLINVLTSPASTFETILERNSVRDAFLPILVLFFMAFGSGILLQDILADYQWTETERSIENMSQLSEDQKREALDKSYEKIYGDGSTKFFSIGFMGLSWPLRIAVMALFATVIGNMFFGGGGTYGQIFTLTSFAYSASIVELIVKTSIQYFTNNMEVFTGLGLLGLGERGSFIYNFLAGLDLFSFWRIILLAIGMGVLYKKSTKSFTIALTLFWVVELIIFSGLGTLAQNLG